MDELKRLALKEIEPYGASEKFYDLLTFHDEYAFLGIVAKKVVDNNNIVNTLIGLGELLDIRYTVVRGRFYAKRRKVSEDKEPFVYKIIGTFDKCDRKLAEELYKYIPRTVTNAAVERELRAAERVEDISENLDVSISLVYRVQRKIRNEEKNRIGKNSSKTLS